MGAALANAADLDFALVFILDSKVWHRGFSHSIMLALVVCLALSLLFGRRYLRAAIAFGLAFASHAILDYVTTKEGGGVELLWPLSSERVAFGWIGLSELPSRMPQVEIIGSLILEFTIFAPLLVIAFGMKNYLYKDAGRIEGTN